MCQKHPTVSGAGSIAEGPLSLRPTSTRIKSFSGRGGLLGQIKGSEAWTRSDRVCVEEAFVAAVATAAHLLMVELKICKAAAFQRLPSAVGQTKK